MDTSSFTPLEFSDAFKQYYSSLRNPSSIPFTTPLHSAVLDGNYDRVVFLLSVKRINPNVQDKVRLDGSVLGVAFISRLLRT